MKQQFELIKNRKKSVLISSVTLILSLNSFMSFYGQDDSTKSKFSAGVDVYSNYIWRGTKFGQGPSLQPTVKFTTDGLTVGVWGSFDASGYTESDPYFSYSFPFGLSAGMTDYYYPGLGGSFFSDSANAYEINLGYTFKGLTLSANYVINESPLPASKGGDLYFQAGYAFRVITLTIGAGDGWHTSDGEFNVCYIAASVTRNIEVTDRLIIPAIGQVILNPERKQLFVVAGISF